MAVVQMTEMLRGLTRGMAAEASTVSDPVLVRRFLESGSEDAFEILIRRHGPMVYRVCWRVAGHDQDAEDAFQATFLVLAQNLRTLRNSPSLASWLHGVARRVALKARERETALRRREQLASARESAPPANPAASEVNAVLDEELSRLPERWRLPLVLCYLEQRTQDEAARELGWAKRTLRRRLDEARAALATRLARRGVWASVLAGVVLSDCAAPAALPRALVGPTVHAAVRFVSGQASAAVVADGVSTLTEGVLNVSQPKLMFAVAVFVAGALVLGAGAVLQVSSAAPPAGNKEPPSPGAVIARPAPVPKAAQTDLDKLQGEWVEVAREIYGVEEAPPELVKMQNVKLTIKGDQWTETFRGGRVSGTVKIDSSKTPNALDLTTKVDGKASLRAGIFKLEGDTLTICLARNFPILEEDGTPRRLDRPREFKVTEESTELRVWKPAAKQENRAFTAWGKEINGLQAGLGFRSGERRVYHHGETVKLVLRVRNLGKETVKFLVLRPLIEHSLAVTDAEGKAVPQAIVIPDIGERIAGVEELPPGTEIELHELQRQLRPATEGRTPQEKRPVPLYGTGHLGVQYDHVLGPPEFGRPGWQLDPTLSKLATGKLELEVRGPEELPQEKGEQGSIPPARSEVPGSSNLPAPPEADTPKTLPQAGIPKGEKTLILQPQDKAELAELLRWQGRWVVMSAAIDGKARRDERVGFDRIEVEGHKVTVWYRNANGNDPRAFAEVTGKLKLMPRQPVKGPLADDGFIFEYLIPITGNYHFTGGQLVLCFCEPGTDEGGKRPVGFGSWENSKRHLYRLERAKEEKAGTPAPVAGPGRKAGFPDTGGGGSRRPPDITGRWHGAEWGTVELATLAPGKYVGTYTDTFGPVKGAITLEWLPLEQQYRGKWGEGKDRFGTISVRSYGGELRGAFTTDPACKLRPGTPGLSDLKWIPQSGVN